MKRTDSPTGLVWFRRDLRLADHPALAAAAKAGHVVPVYIWDDNESKPWAPGAASRWWLHRSLTELQRSLEQRGSRLIVRRGPAADVLLQLCRETGAQAVYWNRRYEPSLIEEDKQTKLRLRAGGLAVESSPGNLLFEPWTVQNKAGKPFQVFTPFWKALSERMIEAPLPAPAISAPDQWPSSLGVSALRLEPSVDWASGLRDAWEPGEPGAMTKVKEFLKGASKSYSEARDLPDRVGTSLLSPYLTFGEISPRQVWHLVNEPSYRRQIAWREFAHHLLFHFPQTPDEPLREEFARFPWKMDGRQYWAWRRGETGYPIVDAGMRQLWHTGWMHNRVRMVAASFLVKHLLIPWQEGARWFWETLVDADLANNTMGWQWVAGCGADAAPYFRIFNPVTQGEKFDPQGAYVRRWVPELASVPDKWIHRPWEAPEPPRGYPTPVVNHEQARGRALAALATLKK